MKKKIFIGSEVIKKLNNNEYKIKGFSNNFIEKLSLKFPSEYLLIEGDGAKRRSIKTPASHEPVIPSTTKNLIVVMGMRNFGQKITKDNVFRFDRIKKLTSTNKIDEELILNLFTSKVSYGSYLDNFENFTAVLNQIDNKNINRFLKIGKKLLKSALNKVILADTSRNNPILKIITK
ncbi:MAG: selenium cofactor biosynthesis protein YqeC [Candidatus Woesearchaeota archaeon]